MEWRNGDYWISDDKTRLDSEAVCAFLAQSYWANQRSRECIERSIANSLCYGVYYREKQIGFARVVTDGATIFWLGDVFIDPQYRGQHLGKHLVQFIVESPALQGLTGVLATNDAHGLYEQYGFVRDPNRYMRRSGVAPVREAAETEQPLKKLRQHKGASG